MMKHLLALTLLLLLNACTSTPKPQADDWVLPATDEHSKSIINKLKQLHKEWKGVPYLFGGMSKSGVDCSGFVVLGFAQKFGLALPRTTDKQRHMGASVNKNHLRAGDLVFFKTGWSTRHVGIYLGERLFLHASTSKGVMISSLDNRYWKQKYWLSRRLQ